MPLSEWDDLPSGQLVLPIRGKKYRIPPLGYLDGIRLEKSVASVTAALKNGADEPPEDAISNEEYLRMVLGDQLDAMRADNVPPIAIAHAAMVAHADAKDGRVVAERLWEAGLDPEALAASMKAAAEELSQRKATQQSPPTESGTQIRSPASTRTTRSPKATKRPGPKAKRSPGKPSSAAAT